MSVLHLSYSLKNKGWKILPIIAISFVFPNLASAIDFGGTCKSYGSTARSACGGQPNMTGVIDSILSACLNGASLGGATLLNTASAAQDPTSNAAATTEKLGNADALGKGNIQNSASCEAPNAITILNDPNAEACRNAADKLREECRSHGQGAAANAGGIDQAGKASGGLMDKMLPALIGAGIGAAVGYMMGKKDESSSSSAEEEEPESLPPAPGPAEEEVASSSASSTGNSSSASNGIDVPAVVQIPTVDPNIEGGSGDSEILVAAGDAIIDDGTNSDGEESSASDGAVIADTTAGGTTGNEEVVAAEPTSSDGILVEDVNVENDENIVALTSPSRSLAGGGVYQFGASESSTAAKESSGSGMIIGAPSRGRATTTTTGSTKLVGTPATKNQSRGLATQGAVAQGKVGVVATPSATTGQSSSAALFKSREEIRADLRRRGLIK